MPDVVVEYDWKAIEGAFHGKAVSQAIAEICPQVHKVVMTVLKDHVAEPEKLEVGLSENRYPGFIINMPDIRITILAVDKGQWPSQEQRDEIADRINMAMAAWWEQQTYARLSIATRLLMHPGAYQDFSVPAEVDTV